jgi:hypothetical protein
MNIQFRKIHLPSLPEVNANALMKLAGNDGNNIFETPSLPVGVSKSQVISRFNLDEIIQDIENHQTENITALEWIHCIYNKGKWDAQNPDKSISTSETLWKAAEKNPWLKQRLFWNLVFNYNGKEVLASSLVKTYSVFSPQDSRDKTILSIIKSFHGEKPIIQLIQLCWQQLLTPHELFFQHHLPSKISIIEKCLTIVVNQFTKITYPNERQIDWLLKCFEEMNKEQQVKAVESLLTQVNPKLGTEQLKLIDWLRQYYGSSNCNSRWNELSSEAKAAMRKWIGAVSYQDFQNLVSLILDRIHLAEREPNRLKSRSEFWSNYSDHFERIRILLPQSSVNILGNYLNHQDVSILLYDSSDATEICIFDFGDWFVVEFFRGKGSETRIFKKDAETEQQLFNSQLSIKKLRCLDSNNAIHDHVFCWQYFCEQWLRQRNILPNKGTERFKGLPYQYSKYNTQTGLPKPSYENMRKRDRSLEYWKQDIARLEREAKKYCDAN